MRLVMAFSLRCSSNGSGGSGLGPHRGGSSRWEESAWCSASNRIFTTSRIAGASRNSAWTPVWEGGRARTAVRSCFRVRVSFAASWFPACPAGTRRIRVACHSAGHSCTVLSVLSARSTVSAMMPASTPREACRTASAFIPAHVTAGPLLPPDQDGGFFRGDPDPHVPTASGTAQGIHEKYGFVSCQPYIL